MKPRGPTSMALVGLALVGVLTTSADLHAEGRLRGRKVNASVSIQLYELVRLGDALVANGELARAIAFYNGFRFNFDRNPVYWRRFALLYEHAGDLERALGCLEHVMHLEEHAVPDVLKQAELLWRLQRPSAALARLVGAKGQADPDDGAFWKTLFQLAWELEQDYLARDALAMLWRTEKTSAIARDLLAFHARDGNYEAAARIADQALAVAPDPEVLLAGVRLAVDGRRFAEARALLRRTERDAADYARHAPYHLARALVAAASGEARAARRDFERAVALDPDLAGACQDWLEASLVTESRAMAERALARCEAREGRRPTSWDLLADVTLMLGRLHETERWRALARSRSQWAEVHEHRPERAPIETRLVHAIDEDDRPTVAAALREGEGVLSLPARVAGLQTLSRHDEAWVLLEESGFSREERLPATVEEATLMKKAFRMRSDWLSGGWARAEAQSLGGLSYQGLRLAGEQRFGIHFFGVEALAGRLATSDAGLILPRAEEYALGVSARRQRTRSESAIKAGVRLMPTGVMPYGRVLHNHRHPDQHFQVQLQGFFGRLPTETPLLRAAGLEDGIEAAARWVAPLEVELGSTLTFNRLAGRDRELVAYGLTLTADGSRRFSFGGLELRPRLVATRVNRLIDRGVPISMLPFLPDNVDVTAVRGLDLGNYTAAGGGLALGQAWGEEAEGRGPHVSLRYGVQATAVYVWPSSRPGFGLEGQLGLIFAARQEVTLTAFLYDGWREIQAQQHAGGSLSYALRWF